MSPVASNQQQVTDMNNIIDGKAFKIISDRQIRQRITGNPLGEHCTRVQIIKLGSDTFEAAWFHDDNGKLVTVTSRKIS